MLNNYDHKFRNAAGRLIFVPTKASRTFGEHLIKRIEKRWSPPNVCYHLLPGGHVAAARAHVANLLFVRMDISDFFDSISRTKIHRALRWVGLNQSSAYEAAMDSTVSKNPSGRGPPYSLPFGFVQSPLLATLALMSSALGRAILEVQSAGLVNVSVYMDDIILSGVCSKELQLAMVSLEEAASSAGFAFNSMKGCGPAHSVTAFNLDIQNRELKLTEERVVSFTSDILAHGNGSATDGIIGYVRTVNPGQAAALATLL